jgi:hypothetical protein
MFPIRRRLFMNQPSGRRSKRVRGLFLRVVGEQPEGRVRGERPDSGEIAAIPASASAA